MSRPSLSLWGILHHPTVPTKIENYDRIGGDESMGLPNTHSREAQLVSRKSLSQAGVKVNQPERVPGELVHSPEIGEKDTKRGWPRRAHEAGSGTSRCADLAPWQEASWR